jgi:hypothetical protein
MAASSTSPVDQAVSALLDILDDYLPPPVASIPEPSVAAINLHERSVGLGNHRGTERRGAFLALALKGVRLEGAIRFQLWATTPVDCEAAMTDLNGRLMGDKGALWNAGILQLALERSTPPDLFPSLSAWRTTASYRVLFEFRYEDSDGAESVITRIPIDSDLEVHDAPERETTAVTDEMVRWDNEAAAPLTVRGPFTIASLSALSFIPGTAPTGTVTVKRTFDGAIGPPGTYPDWSAFLTAVGGANAPERHAQTQFSSLTELLAAFTPAGDPVTLGDWDLNDVPDNYDTSVLALQPPILLSGMTDLFEITFQGAMLDQLAVVYLRSGRR